MLAKTRKKGFTLIEVVASSIILCGAVMIVGTIGTQALIGTHLNRRYEMAASLVDKQLALIDYIGIDSIVEMGESEGDYEESGYTYNWKIDTEYQEIDSLYLVTLTVSWVDRNRPYSISVDTMLNGETLPEESGAGTGQE
ncbi:MAG: type IV pilus modification PilV family protein [Planctomycetota bacterium]